MSRSIDDMLKVAVEGIFRKYDVDKSGTLEGEEIYAMISDSFRSLGRKKNVTKQEVDQFVNAIDQNGDRKISK
jgi:Ca2+-binding EF-hand superfamily protein